MNRNLTIKAIDDESVNINAQYVFTENDELAGVFFPMKEYSKLTKLLTKFTKVKFSRI